MISLFNYGSFEPGGEAINNKPALHMYRLYWMGWALSESTARYSTYNAEGREDMYAGPLRVSI
jgi:hypothetical protein